MQDGESDLTEQHVCFFRGGSLLGPPSQTACPKRPRVQADRPFMGICLGLQLLFDGGDENGGVEGLGIIPGTVGEFTAAPGLPVPHIGWNTLAQQRPSRLLSATAATDRVYFVHSFRAVPSAENGDWVLATSRYGEDFVAAVAKGSVHASQFHPEKSGRVGLQLLENFVNLEVVPEPKVVPEVPAGMAKPTPPPPPPTFRAAVHAALPSMRPLWMRVPPRCRGRSHLFRTPRDALCIVRVWVVPIGRLMVPECGASLLC